MPYAFLHPDGTIRHPLLANTPSVSGPWLSVYRAEHNGAQKCGWPGRWMRTACAHHCRTAYESEQRRKQLHPHYRGT